MREAKNKKRQVAGVVLSCWDFGQNENLANIDIDLIQPHNGTNWPIVTDSKKRFDTLTEERVWVQKVDGNQKRNVEENTGIQWAMIFPKSYCFF